MRPRNKKRNMTGKEPCDLCNTPFYLVEHHINGRKCMNAEHMSNITNVCPNCHYLIHLGVVVLEGWAMTGSGYELLSHEPDVAPLMKDAIVHTF